jgi:hypothetical protein
MERAGQTFHFDEPTTGLHFDDVASCCDYFAGWSIAGIHRGDRAQPRLRGSHTDLA